MVTASGPLPAVREIESHRNNLEVPPAAGNGRTPAGSEAAIASS
jgi:hypothetical protein